MGLCAPAGGGRNRLGAAGPLRAGHRRRRPHPAEGPLHHLRAGGGAAGAHHPARGRPRGGRRRRGRVDARDVAMVDERSRARSDGRGWKAAAAGVDRAEARIATRPHRAAGGQAGTGPHRKAGRRRLRVGVAARRGRAWRWPAPSANWKWRSPNTMWRCTSRQQAAAVLQPRPPARKAGIAEGSLPGGGRRAARGAAERGHAAGRRRAARRGRPARRWKC